MRPLKVDLGTPSGLALQGRSVPGGRWGRRLLPRGRGAFLAAASPPSAAASDLLPPS